MTSVFPPAAVPGPDDVPEEERGEGRDRQQPDPFGEPTDEDGRPDQDADPEERSKEDPRGQ
jgi:hypothetical protein